MRPQDLKKRVLARNPLAALQIKKDLAFQVARNLERARIAKGYTQKKLADKIGTYQANIARAESGNSLPSLTFLKKIADAFETYLIPPQFAFMLEDNRFVNTGISNRVYGTNPSYVELINDTSTLSANFQMKSSSWMMHSFQSNIN